MRKSGRSGLDQEVNRSAPLAFTLDDLRREFLPQYLARGVPYANQGRVAGLRVSVGGGLIEATVRGSDHYGVQIELTRTKDGRVRFDGFCDCPLARNCKHVAATLLTALQTSRAAIETVEAVDPRIKRFFCRFSVAKRAMRATLNQCRHTRSRTKIAPRRASRLRFSRSRIA